MWPKGFKARKRQVQERDVCERVCLKALCVRQEARFLKFQYTEFTDLCERGIYVNENRDTENPLRSLKRTQMVQRRPGGRTCGGGRPAAQSPGAFGCHAVAPALPHAVSKWRTPLLCSPHPDRLLSVLLLFAALALSSIPGIGLSDPSSLREAR